MNKEIHFIEYRKTLRDMYQIRDSFLAEFKSIRFAETTFPEDKELILTAAERVFGSIEASDKYFIAMMNEGLSRKGGKSV